MQILRITIAVCVAILLSSTTHSQQPTLTREACEDFAARLIAAIESGNPDNCKPLYDSDAFVNRWFQDLEFPFSDRDLEQKRWKQRFRDSHALYLTAIHTVGEGGSINAVSVRPGQNAEQLVLRLLDATGSVNYQLLTLQYNHAGQLVVSDLSVIGSVASSFDVVRTTVARFTPTDGPDGKTIRDVPHAERIIMDKRLLSGMNQQFAQGSYANAWHFYSQLSPELQKEKYPLLLAANAAVLMQADPTAGWSPERCKELADSLIDLFRKKYPDDPSIEIAMFNHHINVKAFESALQGIDIIEKRIGGDPYLQALRATIYVQMGRFDEAAEKAEAAVTASPDLPQVYLIAADVAVHQGNYARAAEFLTKLASDFELTLAPEPDDGAAWRHFFESEEYRGLVTSNR